MLSDTNTAIINTAAIQEMLDLPKLYGPNGFENRTDHGTGGPPADLVAALKRLETATVDQPNGRVGRGADDRRPEHPCRHHPNRVARGLPAAFGHWP